MMTHQRPRGRLKEADWKRHDAAKVRTCVACKNTRKCQTCQGAGCMDCEFVGSCMVCIRWAKKDEDEQ